MKPIGYCRIDYLLNQMRQKNNKMVRDLGDAQGNCSRLSVENKTIGTRDEVY